MQISDRLQEAYAIRQKLHDTRWKQWFEASGKGFWGVAKDGVRTCIEMDGNGYTTNAVNSNDILFLRASPPEELPLYITQPRFKPHLNLIEKLLKGELESIPLRQDLMDEHERLDLRYRHINNVTGMYKEFLKRYVERQHWATKTQREFRYMNRFLYVVTIGKYRYHVLCDAKDIKILDEIEILDVGPEERME